MGAGGRRGEMSCCICSWTMNTRRRRCCYRGRQAPPYSRGYGPHCIDSRANNPAHKTASREKKKEPKAFEVVNESTLFNLLWSHCWELCSRSWAEVSLMQACWLAMASNIHQVTDGNLQRVSRELSCLPLVLGKHISPAKCKATSTLLRWRVGLLTHLNRLNGANLKALLFS